MPISLGSTQKNGAFHFASEQIQKNRANTQTLIIKVNDLQNFVPVAARLKQTLPEFRFHSEPVYSKLESFLPEDQEILSKYFVIHFEESLNAEEAQRALQKSFELEEISSAYFEPLWENAEQKENQTFEKNYLATPNFEARQSYLDGAPRGIDARYGWSVNGGTGKGIRIIDVEIGSPEMHEDLPSLFWSQGEANFNNHVVAVLGILGAKKDGFGISGIAHEAELGLSVVKWNQKVEPWKTEFLPRAIEAAAAEAEAGDLLLIEQHGPGPLNGDYVPVEYYDVIFDLLKAATNKKVICVAASGNGYSNLDQAEFKGAFDLKKRDSGCILVGAANGPESGTFLHLKRADFSNYGSRIDAFGYGNHVASTGFGDLQRGEREQNYTSKFGGTSAAAPIIAGAVAQVLGVAKARGLKLTGREIRKLLRETGTPQRNVEDGRIGNLPNMKELLKALNDFDEQRF